MGWCDDKMGEMTPQDVGLRAEELFGSGWNCAESVLLAVAEALGEDAHVYLATGLGGGVGHSGNTCGAVTGAVLALGLTYGRLVPDKQAKEHAYTVCGKLCEDFRNEFGSMQCRELIGRETDQARRKGLCAAFVRKGAELAMESSRQEFIDGE